MIKTETRADGLIRTYSDAGLKIQKVGTDEVYDEAVDLATSGYSYVETQWLLDDEILEVTA